MMRPVRAFFVVRSGQRESRAPAATMPMPTAVTGGSKISGAKVAVIALFAVLIVLFVLQAVYVRASLIEYEKRRVKDLDTSGEAREAALRMANTLRAYGLSVDCGATRAINNAARFDPESLRKPFLSYVARDSTYVRCANTLASESRDVEYQDIIWLVLRPNGAAEALRADLASGAIKYLAIAEATYRAQWSGNVQTKLVAALRAGSANAAPGSGIARAANLLEADGGSSTMVVALARVHTRAPIRVIDSDVMGSAPPPTCDKPFIDVRFFRIGRSMYDGEPDPLLAEVESSSELVLVALGFRIQ